MKTALKFLLQLFIIISSISSIYGVPATPNPITITQPDGTQLTVRMHGDEFFNYKSTLDGYTLVPNAKGILDYATFDINGKLISSKVKAYNVEKRSVSEKKFVKALTPNLNFRVQNQLKRAKRAAVTESVIQKSYPKIGSAKSLVILVNFKDKSFVTPSPQTAFTNLLNEAGYPTNGGTGSARDYFMACSYGKFSPTFDVVGPVTLPQSFDYYGKNDASEQDTNPQQMIIDACTAANTAGLDFTQYDTDNDGILDNVFVYFAGYNEAEGAAENTVWPHRWSVYSGNKFDGKKIEDYACTSELKGNSGSNMCGIGTFCHEFGHVLGLVDYYHTTDNNKNTLESWHIMDGGAYNNGGRTPPTYSAYDRFFLGYLTPEQVSIASDLTLKPLSQGIIPPENTNNQSFLFSATTHNLNGANPTPKEFFMVEYRKKIGWDAFLPAEGMLIWHIDYDQMAWNSNSPNDYVGSTQTASSHMRFYLQPLIGSTASTGTAFTSGSFSPTTWTGNNINREITNIFKTADSINFKLMGGGILPVLFAPISVPQFSTVQGTPTKYDSILISGKRLVSNVELSFSKNLHFQIKKGNAPETAWAKTLTLSPSIDSIINPTKILVRYNPTEPSFSQIHTDDLIVKSTDAETAKVIVSGISSRPILVVPPIAIEPDEITISSFISQWEPTIDATGYYLTAYNISEGESELFEGFENGLTAPQDWTINAQNLTTSTTYSGKSVPAIQFKYTGDSILTEKYLLPIKNISFFIRSMAATGGSVLVEMWNGKKWYVLENIAVVTTLNTTKNYPLDPAENYMRMRLKYTKGNGDVAIDDIKSTFSQKLEYNVREKWVKNTADTLINLISNRDYYYKIRASDKALNEDKTIKYENITDFSNIIQLRTLENKSNTDKLIAQIDTLIAQVDNTTGSIKITLPSTEVVVNIFNILGQQIRSVVPRYNIVYISNLPRHQTYILQAGSLRTKIVL